MYKYSKSFFGILLFILLAASCRPDPKTRLMSPEVRYMSDTMFASRKVKLNEDLDSICLLQKEMYRQEAIDSLLKIELKRIKELSE